MSISLIMTVYNERQNLPAWFESIRKQTRQPGEMIIVDGGSTDGTWEWLQEKATDISSLRIYQKSGNIAMGRNEAIRQTKGEIIVATDAGCIHDATWLGEITAPVFATETAFVTTAFGPWLESSDRVWVYLVAAATIPAPVEFQKNWMPSSRSVAFQKKVWEHVGGYPEWIPICEDVVFDRQLIHHGVKPTYLRTPLVFWRPRQTLRSYMKQLFYYTRSEGHGQLNFFRQCTRYGVYGMAILFLIFSLQQSTFFWFVPLIIGGVFYMWKFWYRWAVHSAPLSWFIRWCGYFILPFVVAIGDVAKMAGWPVGVWERWTGRIRKL